jgi:Tol biopolymer transport system component
MRIRLLTLGTLLLLSTVILAARQSGNDLYQQGLARETAGDIKGAIQIFERIVREFSSNRALTARALVQLGRWSDLLGEDQARKHYERVIREFADQKDAAAEARARLDMLVRTAAPGAGPARRLVIESKTRGSLASARLTRDGRYVLKYNDQERGFELTEISTSHVRRLTTDGPTPGEAVVGGTSELSSDGRRLAAIVRLLKPGSPGGPAGRQIERTELRVFEIGGRGPGRVLATWDERALAGGFRPFAWGPRNDRVWLFGTRSDRSAQIASVNMSGQLDVLKTLSWRDDAQLPSLSPDGRFLAYHDAAGRQSLPDLHIIATDGSGEHRVEHPAEDSKPMFVPDGSGLVFESNRRGERDLWFLAVRDGRPIGQPRLVWRQVDPLGQVEGFSDTGSLLFYSSGNDRGTYVVPIDLNIGSIGEPTRLAVVNNEPSTGAAFSPDGRYLASLRGTTRLVLRDLMTEAEREIPLGTEFSSNAHADWCPTGDALLSTGYVTGSGSVVLRINVKDSSVQRLPFVPPIAYLPTLCIGDGQDIVYLRISGNPWVVSGSVVRQSLVTGRETTLYKGAFAPLARSMDGTRIAFVAADPKGGVRRSLVTMSAQGGDVSADVMPPGISSPPLTINSVVWMPDGNRLLLNVRESGDSYDWTRWPQVPFSLWEVPLTGAAPRKIGLLPVPRVEGSFLTPGGFSIHPDGKRLTFVSPEGFVQQTWAIDNLFQFIKAGNGK